MTAQVDEGFDDIKAKKKDSPSLIRFSDVPCDPESRRHDGQRLMKAVQYHDCSDFCMRSDKQ
jgi:hypothetical protein